MKKVWMPAMFAGLGGVVLILTAIAARSDEEPGATPRRSSPERASERGDPGRDGGPLAAFVAAPESRSAAPASSIDVSVIRARVDVMEARLQGLEIRRDQLQSENQELSREISERASEARARAAAEGRVRAWEKLLGLPRIR